LNEYVQLRFGLKAEEKGKIPEFKIEDLMSRKEREILT
jgi:hypothetical protein